MKASYEFALLSLLVAFSWGSPLNVQPPKQSVRQVDLEEDSIPRSTISEDSDCYDQSPSCSYWALTGQCDTYPKLHTSCCIWCKHMKILQYVKNYNCYDQYSNCYNWVTRNECYKNPAYMLESCCGSCRNIVLQYFKNYNCDDQSSNCYNWATRNECYKNPAYMLEFCCGSCRNIGITVPW